MNAHGTEIIKKLQSIFPQSDGTVLSALLEQGDAVARYVAQLHDLTLAEAVEAIEAFTGTSLEPSYQSVAAE